MKLIQITDLHIGTDGEDTYGIDVRKNFLDVLEAVKNEKPDHVIISGDLCLMEGQSEVYEWIKGHLDASNLTYEVQSGNHDDPVLIAKCFGLETTENHIFYKKKIGEKNILFLDTTHYHLPDNQLVWLENELKKLDEELILFIHHPPLKSGVPFMDNKHYLKNMEAVQTVLFEYPHPIHIFCGHYHVDKVVQQKNLTVYITPACYFQIDYRETDFKVDHMRIGYREIIAAVVGAVIGGILSHFLMNRYEDNNETD